MFFLTADAPRGTAPPKTASGPQSRPLKKCCGGVGVSPPASLFPRVDRNARSVSHRSEPPFRVPVKRQKSLWNVSEGPRLFLEILKPPRSGQRARLTHLRWAAGPLRCVRDTYSDEIEICEMQTGARERHMENPCFPFKAFLLSKTLNLLGKNENWIGTSFFFS